MINSMIQSKFLGQDFCLDCVVVTEGGWYVKQFGSGGVIGQGTQARGLWIGSTEDGTEDDGSMEDDGIGLEVDVDNEESSIRC